MIAVQRTSKAPASMIRLPLPDWIAVSQPVAESKLRVERKAAC